jgi:transcriptional regulator
MYCPAHFEESRIDILHDLIHKQPLATLVTQSNEGLTADHIPLHLRNDGSPFGTLVGHVARDNPLWKLAGQEILAIFQGPDCYISPSWYATKQQTGKVVPTWNYVVAHAHGRLRAIEDPAWIRKQLEALTNQHEQAQPQPWTVAEVPSEFTERLIEQIIGIEIPIAQLRGKWKVSQNQPVKNRESVVAALTNSSDGQKAAIAELVANTIRCTD